MTQVRDRLPLQLTLVQLQLPPTLPQPIRVGEAQLGSGSAGRDRGSSSLFPRALAAAAGDRHWTLHPGEPGEILLRLENASAYTLELEVSVEGDYPSSWCRSHAGGSFLAPGERLEVLLYFRVEADFFEGDRPLGNQGLRLDYTGRVRVGYQLFAASEASPASNGVFPHYQEVDFALHIRPRSLYLDFLPEIYREIDFIGRMLHLFERAFEPDVEILEAMWAYLDPALAPVGLLPFLGHWVGWQISPRLSRERQRVLVKRAIELHRLRGTRRGLRLYLHLYTGLPLEEDLPAERRRIAIEEDFDSRFVLGRVRLGRGARLGEGKLFHFRVRLRFPPHIEIDAAAIREIVAQVKPAPCTYELAIETDATND